MTTIARNYPLNCGAATTAEFARAFSKRPLSERRFDVIVEPVERIVTPGSSSQIVDNDRNLTRRTSAATERDVLVRALALRPDFFISLAFVSTTPAVATPTPVSGSSSLFQYQSSGTLRGNVVSRQGETALFSAAVTTQTSAQVDEFNSWVEGSLAGHCNFQVSARASALSGPSAMSVYSSQGTTSGYVRNPGFWLADVDFSCASPWNSTGGTQIAGTLVSPRHVVFAAHYPIANNAQIVFVSPAGVAHTRQITGILNHPLYGQGTSPYRFGYPDIQVGVLNSDLTEEGHGVRFARVLPASWLDYLPSLRQISPIPAIVFNRLEQAGTIGLRSLANLDMFFDPSPEGFVGRFGLELPNSQALQPGQFFIVLGDSGNPVFILVNGEAVLIGTLTAATGGSFLTAHIDAVNEMMTSLDGGYQLTPVDLSGFPTY
jgi:hypothetical protein